MIKVKLVLLLFFCAYSHVVFSENDMLTPFEKGNGNQTATYNEVIKFYQQLSESYDRISIETAGITDAGLPLHVVTLNPEQSLKTNYSKTNILTVLINNGIHPGEPDGIDATMMLFRDFAQGKIPAPQNTVLVTIPVYNVGGALNRNSNSRTNQNGPESHGFRGNARNYDLNRDFIKADTLNARAFMTLFHRINPDVFIDNHVSNGADYQYTLTHLMTQHNKLGGQLGEYLHTVFQPQLEQNLADKDWPITPYVNVFNKPPDDGFSQFFDGPRYSTGYTSLFNTLGMMLETHMLKPYSQRVNGTYVFLQTVINQVNQDYQNIISIREKQNARYTAGNDYPLQWQLVKDQNEMIEFLGYEAQQVKSKVTGLPRLKYNRDKPFNKKIPYQDVYKPSLTVSIPDAYIIPRGWHEVIELLKINQIHMQRLESATTLTVESYRIEGYDTSKKVYEGHYPHLSVNISNEIKKRQFNPGDYYIPTNQDGIRYLLEVLEPQATDSFFKWNYFDSILAQKEGFSPYVWEDEALELLNERPQLKQQFESKKAHDKAFSDNGYMQLKWLHHQSEHYEKAHLDYPVYRLLSDDKN